MANTYLQGHLSELRGRNTPEEWNPGTTRRASSFLFLYFSMRLTTSKLPILFISAPAAQRTASLVQFQILGREHQVGSA